MMMFHIMPHNYILNKRMLWNLSTRASVQSLV